MPINSCNSCDRVTGRSRPAQVLFQRLLEQLPRAGQHFYNGFLMQQLFRLEKKYDVILVVFKKGAPHEIQEIPFQQLITVLGAILLLLVILTVPGFMPEEKVIHFFFRIQIDPKLYRQLPGKLGQAPVSFKKLP